MKTIFAAIVLCLMAAACTDAEVSSFKALGDEADITCYSGGQAVFTDKSTGKIVSGDQGIYYRSRTTGKYIKAYADCIVQSN